MIKAGQRVIADFGFEVFEGTCVADCEDWAAEPLMIRDDGDGEILSLHTWLAYAVEVIE